MVKHVDVKGREYTPARPGDSLCRTCMNKEKDCTWPNRSIVICMQYDKEGPGQQSIIPPRTANEIYQEQQKRNTGGSLLEDSFR